MALSVIFTTYNAPEWLEKVLAGYQMQTFKDFEILVADDGSGPETRGLMQKVISKSSIPIRHIWHNDRGFRKCEILNKAIRAASSDYLVFSDGDCIPRADFLQAHADHRKNGRFLSGGYFKLPMNISKAITNEDIITGRCFDVDWLKKQGLPSSFKNTKLFFNKPLSALMNKITPTHASWNGHNSSGWKKDVLSVNGFDERMRYGSQDREFGERLMNKGIRGLQIRYSAICLHLDHSRGYKNQKDIDFNQLVRKETRLQKKTWTDFGISKNED